MDEQNSARIATLAGEILTRDRAAVNEIMHNPERALGQKLDAIASLVNALEAGAPRRADAPVADVGQNSLLVARDRILRHRVLQMALTLLRRLSRVDTPRTTLDAMQAALNDYENQVVNENNGADNDSIDEALNRAQSFYYQVRATKLLPYIEGEPPTENVAVLENEMPIVVAQPANQTIANERDFDRLDVNQLTGYIERNHSGTFDFSRHNSVEDVRNFAKSLWRDKKTSAQTPMLQTPAQTPMSSQNLQTPVQTPMPEQSWQTPMSSQNLQTPVQTPMSEQSWQTSVQTPMSSQNLQTPVQTPMSEQSWQTSVQTPMSSQNLQTSVQTPMSEQSWQTSVQTPMSSQNLQTPMQTPVQTPMSSQNLQTPMTEQSWQNSTQTSPASTMMLLQDWPLPTQTVRTATSLPPPPSSLSSNYSWETRVQEMFTPPPPLSLSSSSSPPQNVLLSSSDTSLEGVQRKRRRRRAPPLPAYSSDEERASSPPNASQTRSLSPESEKEDEFDYETEQKRRREEDKNFLRLKALELSKYAGVNERMEKIVQVTKAMQQTYDYCNCKNTIAGPPDASAFVNLLRRLNTYNLSHVEMTVNFYELLYPLTLYNDESNRIVGYIFTATNYFLNCAKNFGRMRAEFNQYGPFAQIDSIVMFVIKFNFLCDLQTFFGKIDGMPILAQPSIKIHTVLVMRDKIVKLAFNALQYDTTLKTDNRRDPKHLQRLIQLMNADFNIM
ncbi:VP80 [Dione juno nucleopolyhedrovirus]|uniref:VP80 n=1 Tax=Dione juno nucleopolyhedrovirus TaxID=2594175 RepID=A0AAE6H3C5_9ABAC|nr:VP80 [Dione juno nucleopolyhedrovirus]QDL57033.1 VP80 [Dione juno nucleopolyhedrovirus]